MIRPKQMQIIFSLKVFQLEQRDLHDTVMFKSGAGNLQTKKILVLLI